MATVEIQIPSNSAYVRVVRLALASLARTAGADEELVDDLKIAVSEACANSVLAHQESGLDDPVEITWSDDDGRFTVEIADRRKSLEVGPDEDTQGIASRELMSDALLRSLLDEFDVSDRQGGGVRMRLVVANRQTEP
jgi:serine/threonine-protein kinase RsbW